jgi:hypothetical protein
MKVVSSGETSPAKDGANWSRSRSRKPSCGGKIGGCAVCWEAGDEAADRLAVVGGEGGDVYEPGDLVVIACLGDDRATVGVADEDRRAVLLVEDASGEGDVALEGRRWVLDDADVEAVCAEQVVDALPSGSVHESAVHEHDVAWMGHD